MPVDEESRRRVDEAFEGSYGAEVASAMMELLPPAGVPELATKADVASLGRELRTEMDGLRTEMHAEIGGLRAEMHAEIGGLRAEMHAELGALEARLGERLERALKEQATRSIRWTTGALGAFAGVVSGLAGLLG